jgi:hypothetical protein
MFRPYLAILRELFTFRNRHAALVLKSKYFNVVAFLSFTVKYIFRTQFFILSRAIFLSRCSCFCVVLFSPSNIVVVLFSLFQCMSLLRTLISYLIEMSVFISASITTWPIYPGDTASPHTHLLGDLNLMGTRVVPVAEKKERFSLLPGTESLYLGHLDHVSQPPGRCPVRGPRLIKNRIYRSAVWQRLRSTDL